MKERTLHNTRCTGYTLASEAAVQTDTMDETKANVARQNAVYQASWCSVNSILSSRSLNQEEVGDGCGGAFS